MKSVPINLEVPIYVSSITVSGKPQFRLKPLLFNYITVDHKRFESAMSRMRQSVQNSFKGISINRDTMDHLNWFMFNPKVSSKVYHLDVIVKKKKYTGKFAVATFETNGIEFGVLPKFNNFIFILEENDSGKYDIKTQANQVIEKLLERYLNESPDSFNFHEYISTSKEFITALDVGIQVKFEDFGFALPDIFSFFSSLRGDSNMSGENEIWQVSKNLNNDYPYDLGRAFFQEEMVERINTILFTEPYKNLPIAIVGDIGVGKKSIIYESLFQHLKIKQEAVKEKDKYARTVWHVDPTRIISGMSQVGKWQKRMEAILGFVKNPYGANKGADIILVDNAVAMLHIGKSAQNNMTVNDVLKPYLEKRQIQFVVLASPNEWKIIQEKDRRFSDLFQVIRMDEPDLETAVKMTLENRKVLEAQHSCMISIKAIQAIFDFRRNYLKSNALPGSVIKIIRQLAIKYKAGRIDVPEVRNEFEIYSGLNQDIFDAPNPVERDEIKHQISQGLVGQPDAVKTLSHVIHTMKARLNAPDKPLGSFMFIGPTGVGKTQAAKVLAKYLTGSSDNLMQFDMNEYIDYTAVSRLIGNAENPEGQLTGKVRYQPFGIVLLDEIEKAHPKVLDLLLQILDDARLTDSLGRTIDFSNTIIIMTSNVGASQAFSRAGFSTSTSDENDIYQRAVENRFRPEFVNRIDEIVIFNPLKLEHVLDIARLQIKELLSRDGFVRRTTILNISNEALEWVAKRGFNSRMGGRALKRQIEKDLTSLTAAQLVRNHSKNPILFEIFLENNQLVPKITTLEYVDRVEKDWYPTLPEAERGKGFYMRLIRTLDAIEKKIQTVELKEVSTNNVIDYGKANYYLFKDKIAETKEKLTNLSLGFRDKRFKLQPAIPLRLKRSSLFTSTFKSSKKVLEDFLFQQEGFIEVHEIYHRTNVQYNSIDTEFLNSYLEVSFLKLFSTNFIKNNSEELTLRIESCINNEGEKEMEFLFELYKKLFDFLGIENKEGDDKQHLILNGYSLTDLLYGEEGIHLFNIPYQNPIPIRVTLETGKKRRNPNLNKVIRVYDRPNTLTDLRTEYTNAINITAEEFSLMIYAGIKVGIRGRLIGR